MPGIAKSELVAAVYHRLANPKHWARFAPARDRHRQYIPPKSPQAVSWCLTGAMDLEMHLRGYRRDHITYQLDDDIVAVFQEQYPELPRVCGIQGYNDNYLMTHEGVRSVLEKVYVKLVEKGE